MCQRISDGGIQTGVTSFFSLLTVRQTNASTTQPVFPIFTQIKTVIKALLLCKQLMLLMMGKRTLYNRYFNWYNLTKRLQAAKKGLNTPVSDS